MNFLSVLNFIIPALFLNFLITGNGNALQCQITSLVTGQTVQRMTPIHINASDPDGIKSVWVKVEGATTSRLIEPNSTAYGYMRAYYHNTTNNYQWDWDTQKYPNGTYVITALAYDSTTEYAYHSVFSILIQNSGSEEWGFRDYVDFVWNNYVKDWDPYTRTFGSNSYAALVGKYTGYAALYYAYTTSSSARMKTERGLTYAKDSIFAHYTFTKFGTTYHAFYATDTVLGSLIVDGDSINECYHTFWLSLAFAYAMQTLAPDTTYASMTIVTGLANHIEHVYMDYLNPNLKQNGYSANGMGNAVAALVESALALNTNKYDSAIHKLYDALIWYQDKETTGEARGAFMDGGGMIAEYPPTGLSYRNFYTMSYNGWCVNGLMHMRKKYGGTYGAPSTYSIDTRIWWYLEFARAAELVGKYDTVTGSYSYPHLCAQQDEKLIFKRRPYNADKDGCWEDPDPELHYLLRDIFATGYCWANAEYDFNRVVHHAGGFQNLGARTWQLEAGMAALDNLLQQEPPVVPVEISIFAIDPEIIFQ